MPRSLRLLTLLLLASLTSRSLAAPVVLSLNGPWQLRNDEGLAVDAAVPGVVQLDLLKAGKIVDPLFRDNAKSLDWIDARTWTYRRSFTLPADIASRAKKMLRVEGLDTIATSRLNDREIAQTDNAFRTFEFDVTADLKPGENTIEVTFDPLEPYIEAFIRNATGPNSSWKGWSNVRKPAFHNGWDFCARVRSVGIDKPVTLIGYDNARLKRAMVEPVVNADDSGLVRVTPDIDGNAKSARVSVSFDGKPLATITAPADRAIELPLKHVERWWPRGMGERPIYDVTIELLDNAGAVLDSAHKRVGFRSVEVKPATDTSPMQIVVNGTPIFARGASWVPADVFVSRITPDHYRKLLTAAADANFNLIRTWGGGTYEPDVFFDTCDELGLLVWFDFKFACNVFPGGNPRFADNVRAEITDQLARVSHHPSVGLYCGNNEGMGLVTGYKLLSIDDYNRFFHGVIGTKVHELLPSAAFIGGSPECGDEHNWWVWHMGTDFEHYRESHGLMSEFGFQSFPHPATVAAASNAEDRSSLLSEGMKTLQHNGTQKGNEHIVEMMNRYFDVSDDFESDVWLSQINQAMGLQIGIDHWRSDWPRSTGSIVWQFNDANPGPSWSIVDYFGRRKAAWYAVRRSFAPISIAPVVKDGACDVRICGDLLRPVDGIVKWTVTDVAGKSIANGSADVHLPAGTSSIAVPSISFDCAADELGHRLLWLTYERDGQTLARRAVLPVRPKNLAVQDPRLTASVNSDCDSFIVAVTAERPALWAWIDLAGDPDARIDDNFVDISPGETVRLRVTPSKPLSLDDFQKTLRLRSLFDTLPRRSTAAATRSTTTVASPSTRP